jgi:hypothetical protein
MIAMYLPIKVNKSATYLPDVGWGVKDWIVLARERDIWWVFVNVVLNLEIP